MQAHRWRSACGRVDVDGQGSDGSLTSKTQHPVSAAMVWHCGRLQELVVRTLCFFTKSWATLSSCLASRVCSIGWPAYNIHVYRLVRKTTNNYYVTRVSRALCTDCVLLSQRFPTNFVPSCADHQFCKKVSLILTIMTMYK